MMSPFFASYQFQRRSTRNPPTTFPVCSGWRRPCSHEQGDGSPWKSQRPPAAKTRSWTIKSELFLFSFLLSSFFSAEVHLIKAYLWGSSRRADITRVVFIRLHRQGSARLLLRARQIRQHKYRPNAIIDSFHVLASIGLRAINQLECFGIRRRSLQVQIRDSLYST